jgi:hypothetical protein
MRIYLSLFVDKYCRVAKKNGRYVGMLLVCSNFQAVSILSSQQWYQKASALIYDLQVSMTFPKSVRTLKRLTNNWTFYAVWEGKPTMLSLLWYFLQRLVIVSNMDNYGAASPTWILALAKLTRKGLFESYQLMQTSSATTSTMKWCHSVRLLHSKCTSVSHAMHQSEHGFLVVCTLCVFVCVWRTGLKYCITYAWCLILEKKF